MKKNTVDSTRLAQVINDVWDGIEKSKIGPIYCLDGEGNQRLNQSGDKICNGIAIQALNIILSQVIPKEMEIQ